MSSRAPTLRSSGSSSIRSLRESTSVNGLLTPPTSSPSNTAPIEMPVATASHLRFVALCGLSFGLNLLLLTAASGVVGPELAVVSRKIDDLKLIGALYAWKFAELGVAWYNGYDYLDLSYLTLLNNVPYYFLLSTFYVIPVTPLLTFLGIDIAAVALPFALLRHKSPVNRPTRETVNKEVAWDPTTRAMVVLLGAALHAAIVFGSFLTWMPKVLIENFYGLRSLEGAYNAALPTLLAIFVPTGFALAHFIFVPAIGSPTNPGLTDPSLRPDKVPFNPETATLAQTVAWNLGLSEAGLSPRAQILIHRTAVLAVGTFLNTFLRVYFTIEGSELKGSVAWASVWFVASVLTGVSFSLVGDE